MLRLEDFAAHVVESGLISAEVVARVRRSSRPALWKTAPSRWPAG